MGVIKCLNFPKKALVNAWWRSIKAWELFFMPTCLSQKYPCLGKIMTRTPPNSNPENPAEALIAYQTQKSAQGIKDLTQDLKLDTPGRRRRGKPSRCWSWQWFLGSDTKTTSNGNTNKQAGPHQTSDKGLTSKISVCLYLLGCESHSHPLCR